MGVFDYSTIKDPAASAWAANHDGKIDAYWQEQWRTNTEIKQMIRDNVAHWHAACADLERKMDQMVTRMEKLSNRVFAMMGAASVMGGLVTLMLQAGYRAVTTP